MDNYERNNRIAEALSIRGMKQVELAEKTGLGKTSINSWIAQRWQPKHKALMAMAKALDVSEMWLAGHDTPMERPVAQKKMDKLAAIADALKDNDRLFVLVSQLTSLTDSQLDTVETLITEFSKLNSN